jgi:hypothetical protein
VRVPILIVSNPIRTRIVQLKSTYPGSHRVPFLVTDLVLRDVIRLRKYKQEYDHDVDAKKDFVSTFVFWFVIVSINIGSDDIAKLHTH